jgi:hypothetical protein
MISQISNRFSHVPVGPFDAQAIDGQLGEREPLTHSLLRILAQEMGQPLEEMIENFRQELASNHVLFTTWINATKLLQDMETFEIPVDHNALLTIAETLVHGWRYP